jgi:hypothetical protein
MAGAWHGLPARFRAPQRGAACASGSVTSPAADPRGVPSNCCHVPPHRDADDIAHRLVPAPIDLNSALTPEPGLQTAAVPIGLKNHMSYPSPVEIRGVKALSDFG